MVVDIGGDAGWIGAGSCGSMAHIGVHLMDHFHIFFVVCVQSVWHMRSICGGNMMTVR